MSTENTLRAFISIRSDIPFAYDQHETEAVERMRKSAAERGLTVPRENVTFLGRVEHPESGVNREGVATYGFEAEAVEVAGA